MRQKSNEKHGFQNSERPKILIFSIFALQQPGLSGITANKTGTLNTKTLTASQLATNSPILPHKFEHNSNNSSQSHGNVLQ